MLTEDQKSRIRPYVSNLHRDVFALAGLPEEVIAVLFAYYSRSRDDLRTNLAKLLADEDLSVVPEGAAAPPFKLASDKARAFHEKWVVGYGHASVAEHAVIHLAVEGVSIVASKAIEDLRLGSYTEKSTRYVLFDEASFHPLAHLPGPLATLYHDAATSLFRTYLSLVPQVEEQVRRRTPRGDRQTDAAYRAAVRAQTFDLLRGLLPAGTKTNLGLTANARALEVLLSKMLASPLEEVRSVAVAMHDEATTVTPTLVKYVSLNAFRSEQRERGMVRLRDAGVTGASEGDPAESGVRVLRFNPDAIERILLALAYEAADAADADVLRARIGALTPEARERLVASSLDGRGKFDPPARAFEAATLTCEVTTDFGAYRDLQRHRMLSPFTQRLGCSLGAEIPHELDDMGFGAEFRRALSGAERAWAALGKSYPWEAQYVVPLAFRTRTLWQLNVRELFHVIELRSARQGHPSYRRIAQELYRASVEVMPWLRDLVRVDLADYRLSRG